MHVLQSRGHRQFKNPTWRNTPKLLEREELCHQRFQPAPCMNTINKPAARTPGSWGMVTGIGTGRRQILNRLCSEKPDLPRSPLSSASAKGGLRSFSRDSSWGLASSISRSNAGFSKPWGNKGASGGDGRRRCAGGWRCWADVPGTAMLLKSILGRAGGKREQTHQHFLFAVLLKKVSIITMGKVGRS